MLIASVFVLWVVVALLVVAVIALARQIGVLHERIAPMGALVADGGPRAGQAAPQFAVQTLSGQSIQLGGRDSSGRMTLLLFVAPDCPICKKIIPIAMGLAQAENLRLVFVGDGDADGYRAMITRHGMAGYDTVLDAQVGLGLRIGKLPSAVLIKPDGVLAAQGLVNSREHLESLIVAHETGFATAQDYLRDLQAKGDTKVVGVTSTAVN
jgi:methylamine dehydrogenase accessory protein MauD